MIINFTNLNFLIILGGNINKRSSSPMTLPIKSTAYMHNKKRRPKILVLSGGGVLGIAEIGVCDALENYHLLDEVVIGAASSIGSLVLLERAFRLKKGSSIEKLQSGEIDLNKFQDYVGPTGKLSYKLSVHDPHLVSYAKSFYNCGVMFVNFTNKLKTIVEAYQKKGLCYGLHIEQTAKNMIQEAIQLYHKPILLNKILEALKDEQHRKFLLLDRQSYDANCNDADIVAALTQLRTMLEGTVSVTLGALHLMRLLAPELRLIDMVISATNVSTDPLTPIYLSYITKPNMPIEKALHASMAVPGLFSPVEYEGVLYTDGGILDNTPYQFFKESDSTKNMPMFVVDFGKPQHLIREDKLPISTFNYAKRYAMFHFDAQRARRPAKDHENILYLHDLKASFLDFSLSKQDQKDLYQRGYDQAEAFLKEKNYIQQPDAKSIVDHTIGRKPG